MKHIIYIVTICVIFSCFVILYMDCRNLKDRLSGVYEQQKSSIAFTDNILYESIDVPIENKAVLGKYDVYYDFNKKSCYLIFRYSQNMCTSCIRNTLLAIKKVFPNYEKDEYILFSCAGLEERMRESFYGKRNLSFVLDSLTLPLEQYQFPYFFIL